MRSASARRTGSTPAGSGELSSCGLLYLGARLHICAVKGGGGPERPDSGFTVGSFNNATRGKAGRTPADGDYSSARDRSSGGPPAPTARTLSASATRKFDAANIGFCRLYRGPFHRRSIRRLAFRKRFDIPCFTRNPPCFAEWVGSICPLYPRKLGWFRVLSCT
jgi:hypothetical protein